MNQLKVIKTQNAMDESFRIICPHPLTFSDYLKMLPTSLSNLRLLPLLQHHATKTLRLIIIQPLLILKKASFVGHRVV